MNNMQLHELPKTTTRGKRRLGLGHGSGRVKTAGRGTKGQNARGKVALSFEGGALRLIKRLPFLRGKGRNSVYKLKPLVINLSMLSAFPKGAVIDIKALVSKNIVEEEKAMNLGVKILGEGEITNAMTFKIPVSKSAKEKIEKAGGTVE